MEKEFIPYEQALSLKELGFDEKCLAGFYTHVDENFVLGKYDYRRKFNINYSDDDDYIVNTDKTHYISAPLYQQAFRWFRKTHNLHGFIENSCIMNDNNYNCFINATDQSIVGLKSKRLFNMYNFKTYKEAELACLKKLIEICSKLK